MRIVFVLAALILAFVPSGARAQSAAEAAKTRMDIMKALWPDYYREMSRVARGETTDISFIPAKAAEAVAQVKKLGTLFPAGSGREAVPTTRSKPEVWTQKAEFDAALAALVTETTALSDAAKSGNLDAVKAQWQKTAQACGGCHGGQPKSGGKFRFEEP